MSTLKGTRVNQYPKQFKATTFAPARLGFVTVYKVTGTEEELEQYKAAQGENLKIDEENGNVLFYSPDGSGDTVIDLRIGRNGGVTEVNEFRTKVQQAFIEAGKLSEHAVGALAQEYGKATIADLFANRRKASAPVITMPAGGDAGADAKILAEQARVKAEAAAAGVDNDDQE